MSEIIWFALEVNAKLKLGIKYLTGDLKRASQYSLGSMLLLYAISCMAPVLASPLT